MFASQGMKVHGVDINPHVIETLKQGRIHIEEPGLATVVNAAIQSGNLSVHLKPAESDVFIIAVPTPYHHKENDIPTADMSYVQQATESILPFLRKGNLIILESTSPAGTTRDLIVPLIEKCGFKPGRDIGVAYCPERVIPGHALQELIGNDRVIGAIDQTWGEFTKRLYKTFVSGEIFLTEPTVAEMVKLLENTFRDVNIALANEVALICEKLGINVWEVIRIANRHPRVNVHKPGPGVGGHCISVDPWFLVEKFPNDANLIHLSRTINDKMPHYVAGLVKDILKGKTNPKIAILGLAYKGNVDDDRESPAVTVVRLLKKQIPQATLAIYEPHVKSKEFKTDGIQEVFKDSDLALLLTPHEEYRFLDPQEIGGLMATRVILDTHNFLKSERWLPAGFDFHVLGSGRHSRASLSEIHDR
ncbi:MAG: UDP-N-acetyl-D-mannosamine dehydrogenase [Elusimicrobia bacterium]|nr:UDP-N-acetyl-D-mannosamine dehydrogenase [Elusimicrobiota bacterium]